MNLIDRINKVINIPALENHLKANGYDVLDFQLELQNHIHIDTLPLVFQGAILAGERELNATGELTIAQED